MPRYWIIKYREKVLEKNYNNGNLVSTTYYRNNKPNEPLEFERVYKEGARKYIGEWKNGKENGIGTYTSRNRDHVFAGQFKDDIVEGVGFKSWFEGEEIYGGEFKDNEREGIGYCRLEGKVFIGKWREGIIDGFGVLITEDNFKFIGTVRDWKPVDGQWYDNNDKATVHVY